MSRYHSYLNSATRLLTDYKGEIPFSAFLKQYFSGEKKYGAKDRRMISQLCYVFFRLGKAVPAIETEERILLGLLLSSQQPDELLDALKPEWSELQLHTLQEKISASNTPLKVTDIFPWQEELSDNVDWDLFCISFLIQPELFLRLRPGKEDLVRRRLKQTDQVFKDINDHCLALPNGSKADKLISMDEDAVVQDYNSQNVANFFPPLDKMERRHKLKPGSIWDCCAASGGKSILAFDNLPGVKLAVSDIRESILSNLHKRFARAGIKNYQSFLADLSVKPPKFQPGIPGFDLIICDAPCTGSGTWSRTPEQLYFFDPSRITYYSELQKKIISNAVTAMKKQGYFLYITCSVFRKENEEAVSFIKNEFGLELIRQELLPGYHMKADTLFVALFQNKS